MSTLGSPRHPSGSYTILSRSRPRSTNAFELTQHAGTSSGRRPAAITTCTEPAPDYPTSLSTKPAQNDSNGGEQRNIYIMRVTSSQRSSPRNHLGNFFGPRVIVRVHHLGLYSGNQDSSLSDHNSMGTVAGACTEGNASYVFVAKLERNGCRLHGTAEHTRVTTRSAASWRT